MPVFAEIETTARITWLGHVPDREASLTSQGAQDAFAGFAGIAGEDHGGLTRASCSRVGNVYERGTEIKNTRQFSIVSNEELAQIKANMDAEQLKPEWLGASLVVEGLPDLSFLPPSTRLLAPSGACLVVDINNRPCHLPVKVLEAHIGEKGRAFKTAAKDLRGVIAWVEREGRLAVGDALRIFVPDQRAWRPGGV